MNKNDSGISMSNEEINKIFKISKLYFEAQKTQKEIADLLSINQSEVSRYLTRARKENEEIIKVSVSLTADYDLSLKSRLLKQYPHLIDVRISYITTPYDEEDLLGQLGKQCAEYFFEHVRHGFKIGLSCGRTLNSVVNNIGESKHRYPSKEDCRVYALVHPCIDEIVDPTPASLVASIVRQLPNSIGYAYQFPSPTNEKNIDQFSKNKHVQKILDMLPNLDVYFLGIGSIDLSLQEPISNQAGLQFNKFIRQHKTKAALIQNLKNLKVVGECDHQPYNEDGEFLIDREELKELKKHILFLPLEKLKDYISEGEIKIGKEEDEEKKQRIIEDQKRIVAIGGGEKKHKAIYAALKGKFFNVLITDSLTAMYILERNEKSNHTI